MELFNLIKRKLYPITSRFLCKATLVKGILRGNNDQFNCLFIENESFGTYIWRNAYESSPHVIYRKRVRKARITKIIEKYADDIDMCIVVLPFKDEKLLNEGYSFKTSKFIRQSLNLPDCLELIESQFRKNLKEVKRKIRKYKLTYKVSKNFEDFKRFYHEMHLPHIKKQFGSFANIESYESMKSFFMKGFLMIISDSESDLAAALCIVRDGILVFRRTGVFYGGNNSVAKAAFSAIYYFLIHYAETNGLRKVDLMWSAPFFFDGVFKKKREWGASIYTDDGVESCVYFFIPKYSKKIVEFFRSNPIIIQYQNALYGLIGYKEFTDSEESIKTELARKFSSPGLKGLLLLSADGNISTITLD